MSIYNLSTSSCCSSSLVLLLDLRRARKLILVPLSAFSVACGDALFARRSCSPPHLLPAYMYLQPVTICCYSFSLIASFSLSHHSMLFRTKAFAFLVLSNIAQGERARVVERIMTLVVALPSVSVQPGYYAHSVASRLVHQTCT